MAKAKKTKKAIQKNFLVVVTNEYGEDYVERFASEKDANDNALSTVEEQGGTAEVAQVVGRTVAQVIKLAKVS